VQPVRRRGAQPVAVRVAWVGIAAVVIVFAVHALTDFGGADARDLLENWLSNAAVWAAAVVCLAGAARAERSRLAWFLIGAALVSWAIGDTIWSLRGDPTEVAGISDVFWLAWYPLVGVAMALLVRDRVPAFEVHRWIDGIVVMLLVTTPWVVLVLQPAAESSSASTLDQIVDFAYPLGDAIIFGATLGVMALMGWRPGRMWIVLGIGLAALCVADAAYSVDVLGRTYTDETAFDALWLAGMALIAYAAWLPHPGRLEPVTVTGWRAIALPVAAQILAIGLEMYSLFNEVPRTEKIFSIIVLLIATVQIVVTRPQLVMDGGEDDRAATTT
jgi:hypothetical protein